jgi:hypothetical protein
MSSFDPASPLPNRRATRSSRHVAAELLRDLMPSRAAGLVLVLMVGGAALVEWMGWQVAWRHGATLRASDVAWWGSFLGGIGRTSAAAIGIGVACGALARWGGRIALRRSVTMRGQRRACALGALLCLAALAALTQAAP